MPVKYWSFAGLMLTYWCSGRCASCYLCCGPSRRDEMTADEAIGYWKGLVKASPHGCRIHLSGGEPFGDWPRLIDICRRVQAQRIGPPEKIETNAFWATDAETIRDRLAVLDAAGMRKLCISADPYHQQFVPIERCRLLARIAEEMLTRRRVQVRWRDWLSDGFDTGTLAEPDRRKLFAAYAADGRDRMNGRAAELLACVLQSKPAEELADNHCAEALLRSRHVHIDGAGRVMPGVCAGIVLGVVGDLSVAQLWRQLDDDHATRPIVGTLAAVGPVGLLDEAKASGYALKDGYAHKCHLCWSVRRHFVLKGLHGRELGPAWLYQAG